MKPSERFLHNFELYLKATHKPKERITLDNMWTAISKAAKSLDPVDPEAMQEAQRKFQAQFAKDELEKQ